MSNAQLDATFLLLLLEFMVLLNLTAYNSHKWLEQRFHQDVKSPMNTCHAAPMTQIAVGTSPTPRSRT